MEYPKYSVLMSLYIKEKPEFLKLAIDSMLSQTVKPDEIVIVEDGPLTQQLYDILDEYEKGNQGLFIRVKNEKNLGLGLALNEGLKVCKNELVARMDTDDISTSDRCEKQLTVFLGDANLDIVGAFVGEFLSSTDEIISIRKVPMEHDQIYRFAKRRSSFNHPVVMYKKSKVESFGGYADLRRNQDVDLFGRMLYGGCKAQNIDEILLYFRCNESLAKRRKSWENTKLYIQTIKRFYKMGYSSFGDYLIVAFAQTIMFLLPIKVQQWIYKKFLRK